MFQCPPVGGFPPLLGGCPPLLGGFPPPFPELPQAGHWPPAFLI